MSSSRVSHAPGHNKNSNALTPPLLCTRRRLSHSSPALKSHLQGSASKVPQQGVRNRKVESARAMPSRLTLPQLYDLVVKRLCTFQDGRTELSRREKKKLQSLKDWLKSRCAYPKREQAKDHIIDAWRVSPGLCLLIILVVHPTQLGTLKSKDNFPEFREWWSGIQATNAKHTSGLEQIFQQQDLAAHLTDDGAGEVEDLHTSTQAVGPKAVSGQQYIDAPLEGYEGKSALGLLSRLCTKHTRDLDTTKQHS